MKHLLAVQLIMLNLYGTAPSAQVKAQAKSQSARTDNRHESAITVLPSGKPMMWEDRGVLTPSRVYWGGASMFPDPISRVPVPPFSQFEAIPKDQDTSPKGKLTDSKGVKWSIKFGSEVHSDVVATRLAWALGFGSVEGYYVSGGIVQGVDSHTDLGHAKGDIKPDGTFRSAMRFKRHNKDAAELNDSKGMDATWDQRINPGVPPEYLSALLIFDVLVANWDAQPKNCKILHVTGSEGPENWFIMGDMGGSLSHRTPHKFNLKDYEKQPEMIKGISNGLVELNFAGIIREQAKLHQLIPLAHAQWFRKSLEKLTDLEIQGAFDAAFATEALNQAYAKGDATQIGLVRERELGLDTRSEIAGFVAAVRARISEYLRKVPSGAG